MDDEQREHRPLIKRCDPRAMRILKTWVETHGGAQHDGGVIDRGFYVVEVRHRAR